MIKRLIIFIAFYGYCLNVSAQIQVDSIGITIQQYAAMMQENDTLSVRIQNDSVLGQKLWETLESPNSFDFSFDSLRSVKQIIAPDGRFKIFTWQLALNNEHYIQKGIIQFKTSNNHIQLLALKDVADEIEDPNNIDGIAQQWVGAVYYDMIQNEFEGKTYYTLLGFDAYDNKVTHKLIEVLHFDNEQPIFGGDFFRYPSDESYPQAPVKRFIYSYKKGSNAFIRYEKEIKAIVLSELTSTHNDLNEKSTLVPTGDEVYFVWKQGKWVMR